MFIVSLPWKTAKIPEKNLLECVNEVIIPGIDPVELFDHLVSLLSQVWWPADRVLVCSLNTRISLFKVGVKVS